MRVVVCPEVGPAIGRHGRLRVLAEQMFADGSPSIEGGRGIGRGDSPDVGIEAADRAPPVGQGQGGRNLAAGVRRLRGGAVPRVAAHARRWKERIRISPPSTIRAIGQTLAHWIRGRTIPSVRSRK